MRNLLFFLEMSHPRVSDSIEPKNTNGIEYQEIAFQSRNKWIPISSTAFLARRVSMRKTADIC
jgi:hypothetical protein